jgi:hypothetical protein
MARRMIDWAWAAALAILLVAGSAQSEAGPLRGVDAATVRRMYVEASYCAQTATKAMTYQGAKDPQSIKYFALSSCGQPLFSFLVDRLHWEPRDAGAVIIKIVDDAYEVVMGQL